MISFSDFVSNVPNDYDMLKRHIQNKENKYHDVLIKSSRNILTGSYARRAPNFLKTLSFFEILKLNSIKSIRQYFHALYTLDILISEKRLIKSDFNDVLNFGCGRGEASQLLARNSKNLISIENDNSIRYLKGFKPIVTDGIQFMDLNKGKFGLITAFYLGETKTPYDTSINFINDFFIAAYKALKIKGKLMVTSDLWTMEKVRKIKHKFSDDGLDISCHSRLYQKI